MIREILSRKSLLLFVGSSFGVHALLLVFRNSGSVGFKVKDFMEVCDPLSEACDPLSDVLGPVSEVWGPSDMVSENTPS